MVLPLILQAPPLDLWSTQVQFIIVLSCAVALLASDWFAFRTPFAQTNPTSQPTAASGVSTLWAWTALVCAVTALHLILMPKIPVLMMLTEHDTSTAAGQIAQARADATKLLPSGAWVDYVSAWILVVVGPLVVFSWLRRGRRWIAAVTFVWMLCYAVSTSAKFPFVLASMCTLMALCAHWSSVRRLVQRFVIAGAALTALLVTTLVLLHSPMFNPMTDVLSASSEMSSNDLRHHLTHADRHRLWSTASTSERQEVSPLVGTVEAVVYRAVLCPADVSIRWYQYFTTVQQPMGIASAILRPPPEERPSRLVARWAYIERFPSRYLSFANANASFDADAFSRAGALGAALAICLLVAMRCFLTTLRGAGSLGTAMYCIALALLSLLPFQASLQAIVFVQGLWMALALMLFYRVSRIARDSTTGCADRCAAR